MSDREKRREQLKAMVAELAFERRPVVLTSGRTSNYYFDGKQITLHPQGAALLAEEILDIIADLEVDAIGGLTIGADPIVGALAVAAHYRGLNHLRFFIVRKEPKKHGKMQLIEGPELKPGQRVVVVDDVITTGGSVLQAITAVKEIGCRVVCVVALVDRCEGGTEKINALGIPVRPVFTVADLDL